MNSEPSKSVRMDKFLWSVRLFKTRSLAAEACEKHHVTANGAAVKPSRGVKAGDRLTVRRPPALHTFVVTGLTDKRQPASLVKDFITDTTPQEERDRAHLTRTTAFVQRDRGAGRPTKKERRIMDKWTSQ
ncbi:MAG: RNA-binding S4 domain-containing protein [Bacteroidales bacterium]|jgi:ribosome-associated heat shock protein Hsp15|nr:RNA-binding S4 domain-containing protein [Bacteroidales bacterium]